MADNEELLPCPFCGLAEHLSLRAEGSYTPDMPARPCRVVCNHIDHDTVEGPIGYGRNGAIAAWNRRAPTTDEVARKTFVIPDGFEAVLDHNGRATGEVRPVVAAWLWQEIDGPHNLRFATTDALIADKAKSEGRRVIPLYASPTTSPHAPEGVRDDVLATAARELIASRFDTYRAGNNRQVGIQDDNGEKCWIVPFDEMAALEAALKGNRT